MRARAWFEIASCLIVASWALVPVASATPPGSDGAIVFEYEAPVPGETLTQVDLYRVDPDGTDLLQLTATPYRMEFSPAWSPDGTKIAFSRTKAPFGPGSIWIVDAAGGGSVRLTSGIDARDPTWSPDGTRIAFTRFDQRGGPNIVTMRASDGSGQRRITSWESRESFPAWSPDGSTIAFTRGFERGDMGDLWVIDLATLRSRRVTSSPAFDLGASWSPDGSTIVFQRTADNAARIATVRPDGTGLDMLTSGHFDAGPAPSPSGASIAFSSDRRSTFLPDLWSMASDGSGVHRILDLRFASTAPDWQPVP